MGTEVVVAINLASSIFNATGACAIISLTPYKRTAPIVSAGWAVIGFWIALATLARVGP